MTVKDILLGLLLNRPAHGYELLGLMQSVLGEPWAINPGQAYSTLSRLERDGLVAHRGSVEDDETGRTMYRLTRRGRAELQSWYNRPVSRADRLRDEVHVKIALSLLGGPVSPAEIIRQQRRHLLAELHDLTETRRLADPLNELPWLLFLENAIAHLEADLRWLDTCESRLDDLNRAPPPPRPARRRGRPAKQVVLE